MNNHPFGPSEISIRLERLEHLQREILHHIFYVDYEYDVWPGERMVLTPNGFYTDRRVKILYAIQSEIRDIEEQLRIEYDYDVQLEYRNNITSDFGF